MKLNKKVLFSVVAAVLVVALLAGVGVFAWNKAKEEQRKELYAQAVQTLKENPLKLDGSNEVSEALLTAIYNAEYTQPKNIILMIGDGMGITAVEAARRVYSEKLHNGKLAMNYMPVQSTQSTYSVSSDVTDSAAGATALATGYKTTNKVIAMDYMSQNAYTTLLEIAASKGMSTGIVSNEDVTDATPAAFTAHVNSRYEQEQIAAMQLQKLKDGTLDLVLGGGYSFYDKEGNAEVLSGAQAAGVTYTKSWEEAAAAELPLCGLFAETFIETRDTTTPNITDMTDLALNLLDGSENGFFLMIEGAHIDTYGEATDFERTVEEVYDFDCAVAIAMRYVALHPDTILVVTADHETGGLWIPGEATADNVMEYSFTNGKHSHKKVPLLAVGYGTEALMGLKENTDVSIFLAAALGETEFGQTSTLVSKTNKAAKVTFSEANPTYVIPSQNIPELTDDKKLVTMFHITMENKGDEVAALPEIVFTVGKRTYEVKAQVNYIDAESKMIVSYTVPFELRTVKQFDKVEQISFLLKEDSQLTISDIQITTRPLGK